MKSFKLLFYSFLLGFGILTTPNLGYSNGSVIIPVPESDVCVGHGNVNLDQIEGLTLPKGVSNIQFQRFFKNGFIESPEDICVVTFEYEGVTHIVQFKFYELCEKGYIDCSGGKKNNTKVFRLM